ncbi:MAG: hypothetical protein ACRESZ_21950 [Methylococcales bacterium]
MLAVRRSPSFAIDAAPRVEIPRRIIELASNVSSNSHTSSTNQATTGITREHWRRHRCLYYDLFSIATNIDSFELQHFRPVPVFSLKSITF